MSTQVSSLHYRMSYEESLSTSLSTKEFSREFSCSSFEEVKKRPSILKASSSFTRKKRVAKPSGKRISFKHELCEVHDVESYKEFNVDMSEIYDFMGLQCNKKAICAVF